MRAKDEAGSAGQDATDLTKASPTPWSAPEVRRLATSSAEFFGGLNPDAEGLS